MIIQRKTLLHSLFYSWLLVYLVVQLTWRGMSQLSNVMTMVSINFFTGISWKVDFAVSFHCRLLRLYYYFVHKSAPLPSQALKPTIMALKHQNLCHWHCARLETNRWSSIVDSWLQEYEKRKGEIYWILAHWYGLDHARLTEVIDTSEYTCLAGWRSCLCIALVFGGPVWRPRNPVGLSLVDLQSWMKSSSALYTKCEELSQQQGGIEMVVLSVKIRTWKWLTVLSCRE